MGVVRSITGVAVGLVLGVLVGALSSVTNAASSPVGVAASTVLNSGWAWAAVAVAAGWLAGTWRWGPAAGILALIATTTTYYALDSFTRAEPMSLYWPEMRVWWLVSVPFGSALGAVGTCARRPGVLGLLARLVVPVGAGVEMAWLPRWDATSVPPALEAVRIGVWVVAALGAGTALIRHLTRRRSGRPATSHAVR